MVLRHLLVSIAAVGTLVVGCASVPDSGGGLPEVDSLRKTPPVPIALVIVLPEPLPPEPPAEAPTSYQIYHPLVSHVPTPLPEPQPVIQPAEKILNSLYQLNRWDADRWIDEDWHHPVPHPVPHPVRAEPPFVRQAVVEAPKAPAAFQARSAPRVASEPQRSVSATPAGIRGGEDPVEAFVRIGDEVEVALNQTGWVLTDAPERGIAEFQSREHQAGRTVFVFRGVGLGQTRLRFVRQDHVNGIDQHVEYALAVISEVELQARLSGQEAPATADVDTGHVDRLMASGRYEEAQRELEATYKAQSSYHNESLARIYQEWGEPDRARTYWDRNLPAYKAPSQLTAYEESAVVGVLGLAVHGRDLPFVLDTYRSLMAVRGVPAEMVMLDTAEFLVERNQAEAALELLEAFQRRYPRSRGIDRLYYYLARVYEADTPLRNLSRSRDLYETVFLGYPESELVEDARRRSRYLARHFLEVR